MGLTYAHLTLTNGDDEASVRMGIRTKEDVRKLEVTALVDSGAMTLAISEEMRIQLGLEAVAEKQCELADGTMATCVVTSPVSIYFKNRTASCRAFVLPQMTEPLLGCIPIEEMDVVIDPKNEELMIPPERPYVARAYLKMTRMMTQMPRFIFAVSVICFAGSLLAGEPVFKKLVLTDKFYAEGTYYGDFNQDGKPDVVAGPYWYEGPDFAKKHEIYPVEAFNLEKYSDFFGCFVADFNGDGFDDIFVCPYPGTRSYWYENPKGKDEHWKKHFALDQFGNESWQWTEIVKGLGKGPIYNENGKFGFGTYQIKDGEPVWYFHQISTDEKRYQRYTHGLGAGDVNGDGRADLLEAVGWWEQPADARQTPWTFHPFKFADAASHILVFDIDGDGKNDVVCAWHCHLYGLCWFRQVEKDGEITFEKNEILPLNPKEQPDKLSFSQAHAFDVADFNGDGLTDFVTGKRFWAHGSKGDVETNFPAVLYWFELKRDADGGASFIPHRIDDDSGVGTQVTAVDLNGDKKPDIIVSSKKGTFIFLQQ